MPLGRVASMVTSSSACQSGPDSGTVAAERSVSKWGTAKRSFLRGSGTIHRGLLRLDTCAGNIRPLSVRPGKEVPNFLNM